MDRDILHINVCHFMASAEQAGNPSLRGRPVIVAVAGVQRARVLEVSREGFDEGLRRGMWLDDAVKLCRSAVVIPPDHALAARAMSALMAEIGNFSPLCETAGSGHAFLDVTGTRRLFGPPPDAAEKLRRAITMRLSLPVGVGVAGNKLMSKVATRVIKPGGMCAVVHGGEKMFLEPLPVRVLPGLDLQILRRLDVFNVATVGQLAALTLSQLAAQFGDMARWILMRASGEDRTQVLPAGSPPPSVSVEEVLTPDTNDDAEIDKAIFSLAARSGRRLREAGMAPKRGRMAVTYADGARLSGSLRLPGRADLDLSLYGRLRELYRRTASAGGDGKAPGSIRRVRVRRIAVVLDHMTYPSGQIELFEGPDTKEEGLMRAIDSVRSRFGDGAVLWGREGPCFTSIQTTRSCGGQIPTTGSSAPLPGAGGRRLP